MVFLTCRDEIVPDTPDGPGGGAGNGDKEIPVVIKMKDLLGSPASTYGTDYPGETSVDGSNWENDIQDVTVYIFDNTFTCEKIIYMAPSSPVGPVMVKTGYKNFIAVINADQKITLPSTTATANYAAISRMLINASSSLPTSPFLMTGSRLNVPLPDALPDTAPYDITIGVERACAKVTLNVTKSGQAATHDINLTKITLHQGANQVALLEDPNPDPRTNADYNLTASKSTFEPSTGEVPLKSSNTYCVLTDSFYTYESLCGTDKSKAVWIELESTVNSPLNIRTAKFYLGEYLPSSSVDTLYDVKRNYWYDVYVDIVKPGLDSIYITVNACPWNVAEKQDEYPGAGYRVYNMASPFKLVKNYTASDISKQSDIAAIATHTKGASWLEFAVTNGDAWKLAFDSEPENVGARMSKDNGVTWKDTLLGIGDDQPHRVYIYRPYVENAEPKSGPTFSLNVGGTISGTDYSNGTRVRDFVVQPRDTTPIPTNSYILRPELSGTPVPPANKTHVYIPLKGVYRYWEDYLLANGVSIPVGTITAELLWQDRSVGDVVKNISVINADKRDSAYLYAEAGSVPGNAVVAMKVNSVIYWSFHLWVTEYNPYEAAGQKLFNGTTRNIFMDRNLGALSNEYDVAGEARGLFYQFGRKDPFPRGTGWLGGNANFMWYKLSASSLGSITLISTLAPMPPTDLRPLLAIPATLNNPTTFYNVLPWPLSAENEFLWDTQGGNKSAFDPCPEGWRIPPQRGGGSSDSPWDQLPNNFVTNVSGYTNGRYHSVIGYYPFSGILSNGSIDNQANIAYFWTSYAPTASDNARGLYINATNVSDNNNISKSSAVSVRCVVDVKYMGGLFGRNAGGM
jgi:hypothetical protein